MREHLVRYFEEHRKLVEADALALLLDSPQPLVVSRRVVELGDGSPFVTREIVERAIRSSGARRSERPPPRASTPPRAPATSAPPSPPAIPTTDASFALVADGFTEPPAGRAPLEAYAALFASRFRALSRLLKGRPDLPDLVSVRDVSSRTKTVSVVGMIREIRRTPEKRHLLLEVEDETGILTVLVPKDAPEARASYLVDEVLGLTLRPAREPGRLARVLSVHRPDVPSRRPVRRSSTAGRVAFLSDLHIGSRSFLSDSWGRFVDFLHGRGPSPEIASEIAHVVVAGDLVDGIGIYPNQERDLAITDVFEQYAELGRRLRELPSRLNVVVVPGNHDAVCPAEPQPALPADLRATLPDNVRPLGNPSTFALDGVVVAAYHGRSFDDLVPAIPGASYARPTEVMKRMLSMRHLAPIYGGRTPLAPLAHDGLVVDPVPDILVTGHAHTFGADRYRDVLLLNASTWQAETEYQRMRNISPVPARVAVADLRDLSLATLDFSGSHPRATTAAASAA
jgi:DNA polymerase II small subunit